MSPVGSPNEAELVALAKGGDKEAFEQLLVPHLTTLVAYCQTICGDSHLAEDVVQETSLIAFRKLNLFFPEADFFSWLKAIARREALFARRRRGGSPKVPVEDLVEAAYEEPGRREATREELALARCLELLPERSRRVVRSHYFEDSRLPPIAEVMRISLSTVKWVLYRARLSLLDCVEGRLKGESIE